MIPWIERPTIDIDLARPWGESIERWPAEAIQAPALLLREVMSAIPRRARWIAYWLRLRTLGRFHAEMKLMARHAGVDWRDVALANLSYDLNMLSLACSTVVLPTADGPVVARNMDWWPEAPLARASYLIRHVRGAKLAFAVAGWPGASGVVTGLSARGFAIILHAVSAPERPAKTGYPVLLFIRRVLEDAPDFPTALAWLSHQKLTVPALLTLVGSENLQRVVIERSPKRHAQRWAKADEPLVVTNHYQRLTFGKEAEALAGLSETTCNRFTALSELAGKHAAGKEVSDAQLLYWLSDEQVKQEITAQHVLIRPRLGEMRVFVPRVLVETNL
jgi:hypothetical protein